jgi:type I restriction enzyme, S subunit
MPDWPTVEFRSLAAGAKSSFSKPYGSAIMKDDYVPEGVPVVRGVNLRNGIFVDSEFVYISESQADTMPGANLTAGDLVFTHRGTIGQVSMIPRHPRYPRYVLSTSQVKARLDIDRAIAEFYYYWFTSPAGQHELLSKVSTVGVPGLGQPVATVKSLRVPHPPVATQRAVAELLGALDNKIAVNNRVAAACHEIAELRYQNAAHGRSAVSLSELVAPILGSTPDRAVPTYWGPANPWASAKDVVGCSSGTLISTEEQITDLAIAQTKAKPVPSGSVVLTARGSLGYVARVCQPTSLNQSCYAFTADKLPPGVLYFTVRSAGEQLKGLAQGTVFSTVNMKTFEHVMVPDLAQQQPNALEDRISILLKTVENRLRESKTLAHLRDTLLPRLMSGEIRVRDAEKIVEDAT